MPCAAGDRFYVYADHDGSDRWRGIVTFLRAAHLEFSVGGTADDCTRVLTIGPLSKDQELSFLDAWGRWLVR
jgi:hypothetical protein